MVPRRSRLSRDSWVQAALDAIAARGLSGVAVEPLASELGVTKGSFYAHFSTRDELVEAALTAWEASHGIAGFAELDAITDPERRLEALMRVAATFSQSGAPSVHVTLLGETHDPRVEAAVDRVTRGRLQWLTSTYSDLGLSANRAAHRARIAYAAYLGLLQMTRQAPAQRLNASTTGELVEELRTTLIHPR